MYIDSIHKNNEYQTISGFNNVLICSNGIDVLKTITFPNGYDLDTNLSFQIVFTNGHNCTDSLTPMTLNDVPIVVNKNGTLIPLPIHEMTESGSTVYKSLQANTILNLYYTSDYDGNGNPAFVIIGNPIVLSSADYVIYADGFSYSNTLSDLETITIGTTATSATTIQYDGFLYFIEVGGNTTTNFYINGQQLPCGNWNKNCITSPVQKGDVVYGNPLSIFARWYKFRNL